MSALDQETRRYSPDRIREKTPGEETAINKLAYTISIRRKLKAKEDAFDKMQLETLPDAEVDRRNYLAAENLIRSGNKKLIGMVYDEVAKMEARGTTDDGVVTEQVSVTVFEKVAVKGGLAIGTG